MAKKLTILVVILIALPTLVLAVTNAKINGQKEITITQLPVDLVFTCDLAAPGNKVAVEYYVDMDNDGKIGAMEEIVEFFYLTDGIGWIKDPQDSENDFAGDETGVDGKIHTTFTIDPTEVLLPTGLTMLIRFVDEDGSEDFVKMHIQVEPQPPFIQGKVTAKSTGAPIQNVFVIAANGENEDAFFGITDQDGDYKISVTNGTYAAVAMQFPSVDYQPSDTVTVTVSNDQSQTVDFQLEAFESSVHGNVKKNDGTPVAGIMVFAISTDPTNPFGSMSTTDAQGNYQIGVMPGLVIVSPSPMLNMRNENWPSDYYVHPEADTLMVGSGQDLTADFVFRPYHSFITGKCTTNGEPLADVQITAMSLDVTTFQFHMYMTNTDENGEYRLGVLPGMISTLVAYKEGYNITSPMGGYMQINVAPNQTVTGKDFQFQPVGGVTGISGVVTFADGSGAGNVYVVAENNFEESPEGFLITYTDASGNYNFENILEGDYHTGVYLSGYSSDPAQRSFYLSTGVDLTGQDFVLSPGSGVAVKDRILQPTTIHLFQNFPNPFNPTTQIRFELPQPEHVTLSVFNASGQLVKVLQNGRISAGSHEIEWDGTDQFGRKVVSGVYFYQLKINNFQEVKRMILTK
ncbi:MAG: T9SS type A sorting domain-containing protein [Calditrichaeota bacterium]|nr:T9SS type A sorting domain-containing protein [Calditrichota bacterium]